MKAKGHVFRSHKGGEAEIEFGNVLLLITIPYPNYLIGDWEEATKKAAERWIKNNIVGVIEIQWS